VSRSALIRLLFAIALVGAAVMIVAAVIDLVAGPVGWSAWASLIGGVILGAVAVYRLVRPYAGPAA